MYNIYFTNVSFYSQPTNHVNTLNLRGPVRLSASDPDMAIGCSEKISKLETRKQELKRAKSETAADAVAPAAVI